MDDRDAQVQLTDPGAPEDPNFVFDVIEAPETAPAAPAASEGPPSEPPAPQGPEGEPAAQPRDESGRFAPKPGETPSAPPGEPAAPSAEAPPAQPSEFTYRADGADYVVEGSRVYPDGSVWLPAPVIEDLKAIVAEGIAHRGSWREREAEYQRQVEAVQQDAVQQIAAARQESERAKVTLDALDQLRRQGPEKVAEWLDNLDRNWDLLMARAENQLLRNQYEQAQASTAGYAVEQQAQQMVPQLETTLRQSLSALVARPEYRGLDADQMFTRLVQRDLDRIFFEADEQTARHLNVPVGYPLVNYDVIEEAVRADADLLRQVSRATERNRPATPPPPTVPAAGTATPSGEQSGPKFKTREEMERYFESGQVFEDLRR